jgi:hypothetical protein
MSAPSDIAALNEKLDSLIDLISRAVPGRARTGRF